MKKPKVQGKSPQVPSPKTPQPVGHQLGLVKRAHYDERPSRSPAFDYGVEKRHMTLGKVAGFKGSVLN